MSGQYENLPPFKETEDTAIDLPLVNIDKRDVLGALFVHTDNIGELYHDALLKFQTWIMNFTEEQLSPLRESGCFTDEELDNIKKKICVISPLTLTMYLHWLQMEEFSKLTDSEKEKILLEKMPDIFKARYKGNASCRQAREISPDEEIENDDNLGTAENRDQIMKMSFEEFLKSFGEKIKGRGVQ